MRKGKCFGSHSVGTNNNQTIYVRLFQKLLNTEFIFTNITLILWYTSVFYSFLVNFYYRYYKT